VSRWREIRKIDAHRVERAVVVPINHPDYFPLDGGARAD